MGYGVKGISSTKFVEVANTEDVLEFLRNMYRNGDKPAYCFVVDNAGIATDFNPNGLDTDD